MSDVSAAVSDVPDIALKPRVAWIWVHIVVAALAMVATLPGRTFGLGLVTEPLLNDLQLGRVPYASINFWATMLGAAFCLPCGWLIDRAGIRIVMTGVVISLGAVVLLMSDVQGVNVRVSLAWLGGAFANGDYTVMVDLFVLVLLTRGLGQSALSVLSLALVGQAAGSRPGWRMGVYSCVLTLGYIAAFVLITYALESWNSDWRSLWAGIGWSILGFAVLCFILVRPGVSGWATADSEDATAMAAVPSSTLGYALGTPAFWVFGLAISVYGLVAAATTLFNQSMLEERGFDRDIFLTITNFSPGIGLASNLATGWLLTRWRMNRVLTLAMAVLTAALFSFPLVETRSQVYLYASAMAVAGGMITVAFFAFWGPAYGPAHLGKIQGAAQIMTVFASALGPLLAATCKEHSGSYLVFFAVSGVVAGYLALAAWWTPLPCLVPASSDNITSVRT